MLRSRAISRKTSISFSSVAVCSIVAMQFLPLEFVALEIRARIVFQVCRLDRRDRKQQLPALGLDNDRFTSQSAQGSAMGLAAVYRQRRYDPGPLPSEAL